MKPHYTAGQVAALIRQRDFAASWALAVGAEIEGFPGLKIECKTVASAYCPRTIWLSNGTVINDPEWKSVSGR